MPQIMALTCPVCAAPLHSQEAERCSYCGSVVFIKPNLPRLNAANLNTSVIHEHIAEFRQRVRTRDYDEEAHYGLGVAYYNLGLTDAAIDELTRASRLVPENPDIRSQLATVYHESGDPGHQWQAKSHLRATLLLDPTNQDAIKMMASILLDEGDLRGAMDLAEQLSTGGTAIRNNIGGHRATSYLRQNELERARAVLNDLPDPVVRKSLIDFIADFRTPMNLVPVNPIAQPVGCGTIFLAVVLFLFWQSIFTGDSETSAGAFMVLAVVTLIFAATVYKRSQEYSSAKEASNYTIPPMDFVSKSSTPALHRMAEGLVRHRLGEVITPEQRAELEAERKQQS